MQLTERWERSGRAPQELKTARQVNLQKVGKEKTLPSGKVLLKAADTRPISVFSLWWRLWGSWWACSPQVAKWRDQNIQSRVIGGTGSWGAGEAGMWLVEQFTTDGFGGTLDYSQCYDMMSPKVTAQAFREAGFSNQVTSVLEDLWVGQSRWVEWNGHISPDKLVNVEAIPQGDAFGPLALNIFMSAGYNFTQRANVLAAEESSDTPAEQTIYMDDRSWTAKNCIRSSRSSGILAYFLRHGASERERGENAIGR